MLWRSCALGAHALNISRPLIMRHTSLVLNIQRLHSYQVNEHTVHRHIWTLCTYGCPERFESFLEVILWHFCTSIHVEVISYWNRGHYETSYCNVDHTLINLEWVLFSAPGGHVTSFNRGEVSRVFGISTWKVSHLEHEPCDLINGFQLCCHYKNVKNQTSVY